MATSGNEVGMEAGRWERMCSDGSANDVEGVETQSVKGTQVGWLSVFLVG